MLNINKKAKLIGLFGIIIVLLVVISLTATFAIWQKEDSASIEIEIDDPHVPKWNESLDYIIFMAVDSGDVPLKSYNDFDEDCYSLAVVGYDGVFPLLEIPETVSFIYNDVEYEKPVYATLMPDFDEGTIFIKEGKEFDGDELMKNITMQNEMIEEIFFSKTVRKIDAVFQFISNLNSITIDGEGFIQISEYAFSGCGNLEFVITQRQILGDLSKVFFNTLVDVDSLN